MNVLHGIPIFVFKNFLLEVLTPLSYCESSSCAGTDFKISNFFRFHALSACEYQVHTLIQYDHTYVWFLSSLAKRNGIRAGWACRHCHHAPLRAAFAQHQYNVVTCSLPVVKYLEYLVQYLVVTLEYRYVAEYGVPVLYFLLLSRELIHHLRGCLNEGYDRSHHLFR